VLPHAASSRTLQAEAQALKANLSSFMTIPLRGDTHEPQRSRPVFAPSGLVHYGGDHPRDHRRAGDTTASAPTAPVQPGVREGRLESSFV
jgi:hypothetical protein